MEGLTRWQIQTRRTLDCATLRGSKEDELKKRVILGLGLLGVVGASGFLDVGCSTSSKCETQCARANQCSGAKQTTCATACATFDAVDVKGVCTNEYATFFDCVAAESDTDACSATSSKCLVQQLTLSTCDNTFCVTNPGACKASGSGGAAGTGTSTAATGGTTTSGTGG